MTCPTCGRNEYIQFVYVLNVNEFSLVEYNNPSDYHFLYMCPNMHIYDENEKIVESCNVA